MLHLFRDNDLVSGQPIATFKGRQAEEVIAWFNSRPQVERDRVEVVVFDMSKTFFSAIKAVFGAGKESTWLTPHGRVDTELAYDTYGIGLGFVRFPEERTMAPATSTPRARNAALASSRL